jgi:Zn-dependent protease with chaperone function
MIVALVLLAGGAVSGWLLPGRLAQLDVRRRDPVLLIVCWLLSMAGVLLAAAGGVLLLLLPGHGSVADLVWTFHRCWASLRHGSAPRVEEFSGALGALALVVLAIRVGMVSVHGFRRRARTRRETLAIVRMAARTDGGRPATLWLCHDRPLAFSMAGRPRVVVATDGLTRHLSPDAVAAVLAHERAHLHGRHHLLIAVGNALAAAFPFVPLFRRAPATLRELAEVAADVTATRDCGAAAVRAALLGVRGYGAPEGALTMARDAVGVRLARLDLGTPPPGRLHRLAACWAAGTTAAALPFLAGTALLIVLAALTCPATGA